MNEAALVGVNLARRVEFKGSSSHKFLCASSGSEDRGFVGTHCFAWDHKMFFPLIKKKKDFQISSDRNLAHW